MFSYQSSYIGIIALSWLVAFCFPNLFFSIGTEYDNKRVITLAGLMTANTLLVFNRQLKRDLLVTIKGMALRIILPLVVLILLMLFSSVFNLMWDSLFELSITLLLAVSTVTVCAILNQKPQYIAIIFYTIVAGWFIYSLLICLSLAFILVDKFVYSKDFIPDEGYSLTYLNFDNPRFMNQVQSWTFPIVVLFAFKSHIQQKAIKYMSVFSLFIMSYLIAATQSRSIFVELVVFIFLCLVLRTKNAAYFIKVILLGFLVGLAIQYGVEELVYGDVKVITELKTSSSGRVEMWLTTLKASFEHFWLGSGLTGYMSLRNPIAAGHPHNIFIQHFYELGVIGLFLTLFLFTHALKIMFYQIKQAHCDELKFYTYFAVVGAMVHSFFSGVFVMPLSQLSGVMVIGIALHLFSEKSSTHFVGMSTQVFNFGLGALISLCSIQVIYSVKMHIVNQEFIERNFIEVCNGHKRHPRIWLVGESKLYQPNNFKGKLSCPGSESRR